MLEGLDATEIGKEDYAGHESLSLGRRRDVYE